MGASIDLSAETALVTGASRNIGFAIAEALRDAGAKVCITGLSDQAALDEAFEALGSDPEAVMAALVDVGSESDLLALFDRIESQLGHVSILVNNAATRPHEPFREMTRESWSAVIDTILTGAFLTSREVFRRLPRDRKGSIINIGGLSAHLPTKDRVHVIAAKAGLTGLTRALAEEGRGRIRVNGVVPGRIDTTRQPGQSNPTFDESAGQSIGTSRDVARAVLAMSDPRDSYVTGQTIHVSGGRFMP